MSRLVVMLAMAAALLVLAAPSAEATDVCFTSGQISGLNTLSITTVSGSAFSGVWRNTTAGLVGDFGGTVDAGGATATLGASLFMATAGVPGDPVATFLAATCSLTTGQCTGRLHRFLETASAIQALTLQVAACTGGTPPPPTDGTGAINVVVGPGGGLGASVTGVVISGLETFGPLTVAINSTQTLTEVTPGSYTVTDATFSVPCTDTVLTVEAGKTTTLTYDLVLEGVLPQCTVSVTPPA
jgi:hypothetical protein